MTVPTPSHEKTRLLGSLPSPAGDFLSLSALAALFGVPLTSARVLARRLERRELLTKVGPALYANLQGKPGLEALAARLWRPCYLSFEWALRRHGISTQVPVELACATTNRSRRVLSRWGTVRYHQFPPALFTGFAEETLADGAPAWVAVPEKAVLDTLYLKLLRGHPAETDEWDLSRLDQSRLSELLARYSPRSRRRLEAVLNPRIQRKN